jgi:hypothetical protein
MAGPVNRRRPAIRREEVPLERCESIHNSWEAPIKHLLVAREKRDLASSLHRDAPVTVELDLKSPVLARWQFYHRLALHRLNEARFCAPPNSLVLRRLCLR